ncbi:type II toxin-antitoxin system HicB family antitoxin [Lysinibacillus sp. RC79]|uniref:type II toxin-antitoxin system HicB family antitoxin n=1 Tax=Lysinibacillus sp. RC79 TaxID=3156296 RepID=UPI0035197A6C
MKENRYIYPAIFSYDPDGISVEFPDLPGCFTSGDTQEEALEMAKEAMALHLFGLEEDNDVIPVASSLKVVKTQANQATVLVDVWMPPFRQEMNNQSVKKTLTIPHWLEKKASEYNVNYSHLLQEALKKHLDANEPDPHI